MEEDYTSITRQNIMKDFQVTVCVITLMIIPRFISSIIKQDVPRITFTSSAIGILLLVYMFRKKFAKYIDYLTLFVILAYNIYKLAFMPYMYTKVYRANHFFSGYTYGILQMILISRCPKIWQKTVAVLVSYALRFAFIIVAVDRMALDATTMIQGAIVDAFILYYYYADEKKERKVFRDFYENKMTIMKFKEFLDDSLPQSVAVIDCNTNKPLFSNKAYLTTFHYKKSLNESVLQESAQSYALQENINKICIESLVVDQQTIREIRNIHPELQSFNLSTRPIPLMNIIRKLIKTNVIGDKVFSMTASYRFQEQKRLFEIILKRVIWDGVDAIALILNDITYQEHILTLKMANSNKDKMLATVAHEIRTPLNGIIGLLEIAEKKANQPEVLDYLSLCKDNAHLLLGLVNSHLDLQQIGAGKLRLNPTKISLHKTLNDLVQLFQFQTFKKNIYLRFNIDQNVSDLITTDESRLKQILINLIGNAIKFTSTGGIEVNLIQNPDEIEFLHVSVIDTGIGIKEGDKEKLFQYYGKLEDKESLNKDGVGLGLTISNVLAAMLSGNPGDQGIEVESEYGVGSNFHFKLLKNLRAIPHIDAPNIHENRETEENARSFLSQNKDLKKGNLSYVELERKISSSEISDELMTIPLGLNSKLETYASLRRPNWNKLNDEESREFFVNNRIQQQDILYSPNSPWSTLNSIHKEKSTIKATSKQLTENSCIVVVDDNPFNVLIAKNLIEGLGYPVRTAIGGQEAIEMVKFCANEGQSIKVILMDCQMPVMSGYETVKLLKGMMRGDEIPNVPIYAFTASMNERDVKKCYEAGMEGYLMKPLNPESFLKIIEN